MPLVVLAANDFKFKEIVHLGPDFGFVILQKGKYLGFTKEDRKALLFHHDSSGLFLLLLVQRFICGDDADPVKVVRFLVLHVVQGPVQESWVVVALDCNELVRFTRVPPQPIRKHITYVHHGLLFINLNLRTLYLLIVWLRRKTSILIIVSLSFTCRSRRLISICLRIVLTRCAIILKILKSIL